MGAQSNCVLYIDGATLVFGRNEKPESEVGMKEGKKWVERVREWRMEEKKEWGDK